MSDALQRAYASSSETPINTIRLVHSALTGGERCFVQGVMNVDATLETAQSKTFQAAGLRLSLPKKGDDGAQDLDFELNNVSREAWQEIRAVMLYNRERLRNNLPVEKVRLEFRRFLPSDLTQPHGGVYHMVVINTGTDPMVAQLKASFLSLADKSWPVRRYFPDLFPGIAYAG